MVAAIGACDEKTVGPENECVVLADVICCLLFHCTGRSSSSSSSIVCPKTSYREVECSDDFSFVYAVTGHPVGKCRK